MAGPKNPGRSLPADICSNEGIGPRARTHRSNPEPDGCGGRRRSPQKLGSEEISGKFADVMPKRLDGCHPVATISEGERPSRKDPVAWRDPVLASTSARFCASSPMSCDSVRPCCADTRSSPPQNLFLRKQMALYLERQVKPRQADEATRLTLHWPTAAAARGSRVRPPGALDRAVRWIGAVSRLPSACDILARFGAQNQLRATAVPEGHLVFDVDRVLGRYEDDVS